MGGWVAKRPTSTTSTQLHGLEKAFPKVTGGAALRGSALVLEDLAQILEDWAQIPEDGLQILEDWAQILEDRMVQTNCLDHPARPLRALPHYAQMGYGEQNPSLNHGWVGRQTTHLNDIDSITRFGESVPETTPRSPAPSRGAKRRP